MKQWILIPQKGNWEGWIYFSSKKELLDFVKEKKLKIVDVNIYNPKMVYVKGEIK